MGFSTLGLYMSEVPLLALCTCPDAATAQRLAATLVDRRLAACVNVLPGVQSTYRWQDEVQTDAEVMLYIKTVPARWEALQACLVSEHPYELPELIGIPLTTGLPGYLDWISDATC